MEETLQKKDQKKTTRVEDLEKRAKDLGVRFLPSVPRKVDKTIVSLIAESVARQYNMAVFERDEEIKLLHIAMVDTQDIDALNILRFLAHKEHYGIELYLASIDTLEDLFGLYGSAEKAVESAVQALEDDELEIGEKASKGRESLGSLKENIQDAPVAKLVQVIIRHALDGGASDIHIEPIDNAYRVRFRVDGILHASLSFPDEVGRAVISRIKIMANLKIDEKRKPQDGRFRVTEKKSPVDFRISTLPVIEGEKVVMRVLEKDDTTFDLKVLGLMGSQHDIFLEHIKDPFGMILMTGPTGSGKSTTLYAFLRILNQEDGNIITLEDPVEYFIAGINQSQVKPEIGYSFASGLRSILRQDPDIIMVGEIRDGETAELAVHASLTGHLVFSTVHTNSAIGAVPRLIDMGIEPFLIASSVRVIAAQRLLRRVCQECKEEIEMPENVKAKVAAAVESVPAEEFEKYGLNKKDPLKFFHGKGCEECGQLGLKGRIAIYEVISLDRDMQNTIASEEGAVAALDALATKKEFLRIKQDGVLKVLLGLTTLTELERITEGELLIGGKIDEVDDNDFEQNT